MARSDVGSGWKRIPLIVRALTLPTPDHMECGVCGATWHRTEGFPDNCQWCTRRRQADAEHILKPPAARGYGHATAADLKALHIDPDTDRTVDLERWRHDLELAAEAGLITEQQGNDAWRSATKNPTSSTSSTGTTSTTTPTPTTKPSSTASPSAAAGRRSPAQRKQANRRSSSPWQFRPHKQATK